MNAAASRTDDSTAELVRRCGDGDGRAWQRLVDRYGALVWSIVTRAGITREDGEDVFQNTWTIAFEELPRLRESERFGAWIAMVARHQVLRVRRGYGISRRARERIAVPDAVEEPPDEEIEALDDRRLVWEAFPRIGEPCGALLKALYYEQPTPAYVEISKRFGMKIGSIGPTRARCLKKLERELAGGGPDGR